MKAKQSLNILFFALTILLAVSSNAEDLTLKQQILMPGPLITHHAEYESNCESCHSPFSKQKMTQLCLDCHKDIAKDRTLSSGFHGKAPLAATADCETCHKDHEGREADIVGLHPENFDHSFTQFPLAGPHKLAACADCHKAELPFRETVSTCVGCHKEQDRHKGLLGDQCEICHSPLYWTTLKSFDHDATDFSLEGKHQDLSCTTCHLNQTYHFDNTECLTCHRLDDVHNRANGNQCQDCHTPHGWKELNFDHNETDFPLHGKHADIPCQACHVDPKQTKPLAQQCNDCHRNDDKHLGRNGSSCQNCHNESKWSTLLFNHGTDTDFPLTGSHQKLPCTQCHIGSVEKTLPRDCLGCHAGDDVHKDPGMTLCATCHTTKNWKSILEFDHDFTEFPLVGLHQIVPCQSCHIGNQFNLSSNGCVSCHAKKDIHQSAMGEDCHTCHSPNAWNIWEFNHASFTHYPLLGSHADLSCVSCHAAGSNAKSTPTQCGSCHRSQDIHNGDFGNRCDQCHSNDSFKSLIINLNVLQ